MLKLPNAFCWTKMGAESGQSLEIILKRKDLERKSNDGIFIWGIGNALGDAVWKFVGDVKDPIVLFSKIKSNPKRIDVQPSKVFLWESYIDRQNNIHEIPKTALVLSRANSDKVLKKKHYALICKRDNPIRREQWESLLFDNLKNYDSHKSKLGYSQVTAIVKTNGNPNLSDRKYDIEFSASLADPYFVKLMNPLDVPLPKLDALNKTVQNGSLTLYEWKELASNFHVDIEDHNNYPKVPKQMTFSEID
ncbi:MAG: hypothetical protein ABIL58_14140 [Pseudomonadota bacterium]